MAFGPGQPHVLLGAGAGGGGLVTQPVPPLPGPPPSLIGAAGGGVPKELWNSELRVGRARGWQKASALTLRDWEKGKGPGVVSPPGGASRSRVQALCHREGCCER